MSWWHDMAARRPPDEEIGGSADPYMRRWWILRSRLGNIYLHHFLRSDDDRALHDHPWPSLSILLEGTYAEWSFAEPMPAIGGTPYYNKYVRRLALTQCGQGDWVFRRASYAHRITLTSGPCWTLFITGPRIRQWGFYCPQGWRHWRDFTNPADGGSTIGRGCE